MGLNTPGRDTDYDNIINSSTDEEKLDVVFKILLKSYTSIWIDYHKLKIPYQDEKLFNAKLKATGLVDYQQSASAYNPEFKLNDKGYLILDQFGSYMQFLEKSKFDALEIIANDENEIKNKVLKHLNTKDVGIPYYFDQLAIDTGLEPDIIQACCLEFCERGYVVMSKQEVFITATGKLFVKIGAYNKESTFGVKIEQIGNRYTTTGNQSPMAFKDVNQSFNKKEESTEIKALHVAQLKNTHLSSELLALQIKEVKTKRKFAVLGAVGGAMLTYFSTHVKAIWILIKSLLSF